MQCPLCQTDNPATADHCAKCATPLPISDQTISPTSFDETSVGRSAIGQTEAWSVAVTPRPSSEAAAKGQLEPGTILADRFEILQLLGQGGMGAVYKARDNELERLVALKLIRPDLASHPEILRRFKQELILAREVTHRNVIRIFDLGQAKGIKFITMEYVEGRDLRALIHEKGKMSAEEAVPIVIQISAALEAAHHAGVVHRDLKPQNILLDKDNRVYVMDFGIARSLETPGMTQTGALMGTPEYMSPEQAKGEKVDARSDLFALGIIFYEMLTGISPFKAETAMAMMFKRTQERATPLAQMNIGVPPVVSDIVSKCLEIKPDERYQTARAIVDDLELWKGGAPRGTIVPVGRRLRYTPAWKKYLAVGVPVVLLLAVGAFVFRSKLPFTSSSSGPVQPISLAILPFRNTSTDPSMDWIGTSLANILSTDVGQSARLRTVSSDRLFQILKDLRVPPNSDFDPDTLRRLAEFSNADILVWGRYAKFGDQIRIDATLQDLKRDRRVPLRIDAPSEKNLPQTMDQLAELIRTNLAVSSNVLKELKASSFQPSSQSMPALRDYNQSLQLIRDGKNLEAVKALQDAIKEDPQFALAYSRLAETDSALGYDSDAEQASRKALDLSQQLPQAERYMIQANHARIMKDNKKAIEAYENLAKTFPDNSDVEYALGSLYVDKGDYDNARKQFSKILQADPKNIKALWQMGVVDINKGDAEAALRSLNQGLSLSVQVDNQEQKALILQAMGISYRMLNKPDEAMRNYQESMDINRRLGLKRLLAANLNEMALVQSGMGKYDAALASYQQALKVQNEIGIKKDIGDTLINMGTFYLDRGKSDKALQVFKESLQIQRDSGDQTNQSLCLNNIGAVYLSKGDSDNAFSFFQQALQIREKLNSPADIADSLSGLGEAYVATGQYDQAVDTFLKAIDLWRKAGDNRGAAMESHQMGLVFKYQGRIGSALTAMQDASKTLTDLKDGSRDMIEVQVDLGDTLAKAGRGVEAQKILDAAQSSANDLKNESVRAAVFDAQGNVQLYAGNLKAAKALYDQAFRSASKGAEQNRILVSRLNVLRVVVAEGRGASAINDLLALSKEADTRGIKYLALEGSVEAANAMIGTKDYKRARPTLDKALGTSEKLGLRLQTARIHYLIATMQRLNGNVAEAGGHYRETLRILNEIRKDNGVQDLLQRADLKSIYDESTRWSQ